MIIGSVKKPKLNMVMGYTKEQASSKIDRILEFSKEGYTKKNRNVSVCGVMFMLTITREGNNEKYLFETTDHKEKLNLKKNILSFKDSFD